MARAKYIVGATVLVTFLWVLLCPELETRFIKWREERLVRARMLEGKEIVCAIENFRTEKRKLPATLGEVNPQYREGENTLWFYRATSNDSYQLSAIAFHSFGVFYTPENGWSRGGGGMNTPLK